MSAIAVRLSYLNATETRNFIAGLMKGGGGGGRVGLRRLRVCESRYSLVLGMVANMDGDFSDDNYSNLAYEAREAKAYVDKCEAQWRNATWKPMGNRNMVVGVMFEVVVAIETSVRRSSLGGGDQSTSYETSSRVPPPSQSVVDQSTPYETPLRVPPSESISIVSSLWSM
ncbi:hypothetical protein LINGRAHAP2_LOCUS22521 [Linum grandiflorum]